MHENEEDELETYTVCKQSESKTGPMVDREDG